MTIGKAIDKIRALRASRPGRLDAARGAAVARFVLRDDQREKKILDELSDVDREQAVAMLESVES